MSRVFAALFLANYEHAGFGVRRPVAIRSLSSWVECGTRIVHVIFERLSYKAAQVRNARAPIFDQPFIAVMDRHEEKVDRYHRDDCPIWTVHIAHVKERVPFHFTELLREHFLGCLWEHPPQFTQAPVLAEVATESVSSIFQ